MIKIFFFFFFFLAEWSVFIFLLNSKLWGSVTEQAKNKKEKSEQSSFRSFGCLLLSLNRSSGRCGRKTHHGKSRGGACLRPPAALRSRVAMVEPLAPFQTETIRLEAFDCNRTNPHAPLFFTHSQPRLTPGRLQFHWKEGGKVLRSETGDTL